MKKINCFIQARYNSVRFPGKVLKNLGSYNSLDLIIKRLSKNKIFSKIVVITGSKKNNLAIAAWAKKNKVNIFHGDEKNVLKRYYQASKTYECDYICRITADCPLICSEIVEMGIKKLKNKEIDYVSNTLPPTFPDGLDFEIFKTKCLIHSLKLAKNDYQKEHVTPIMRFNDFFKKSNISSDKNLSMMRWTLDELEDYNFLNEFISHVKNPIEANFNDLIEIYNKKKLKNHKNQKIVRNEGAMKSDNQKLYQRAKKIIPGGVSLLSKRPEMFLPGEWPTYFKKAKGIMVTDLSNKTFRDFSTMSVGACSLGYSNKRVDDKVMNSIKNGIMTSLNCPEEVLLGERLVELHPWADQIRYARTGGEANAIAIRIARAASNKNKILVCGYHGWHDWYLALNLSNKDNLKDHLLPGLSSKGVNKKLYNTVHAFNYGNYDEFNSAISDDIAAVIMEPCRNSLPDINFLKHVRKICYKKKIILILDECSSGFRENYGGMHLKIGINPDMAMFGKALSNGYAMTCVLGKKEIMEAAQDTFISSTFWTERIGPVAALATLAEMERTKSFIKIPEIGRKVKEFWVKTAKKYNINIKTGGFDAIPNFLFDCNRSLEIKTLFTKLMLERKFLASNSFYASIAHQKKDINLFLEALEECFSLISPYVIDKEKKIKEIKTISHSGFSRLN